MPIQPSGNSTSNRGAVTGPTGVQTITTLAGLTPNTLYMFTVSMYTDGTTAALDDDNYHIVLGANLITITPVVPSNGSVSTVSLILNSSTATSITIGTAAAGTSTAVYHAEVIATPYQEG
jgi:hypothetical protein